MTLNWGRCSGPENLEYVEYRFIVIIPSEPGSNEVVTVRVSSMSQIEMFNHLQNIIITIISYLNPYSCVQIICIT